MMSPKRRWQPLPLSVHPVLDHEEIERFKRRVVMGPRMTDCAVWTGGISDDGYGVLRVRRDGVSRVVRASRYALALALEGEQLSGDVMGLHECDNTVCVRVVAPDELLAGVPAHLVCGDQR